MREMWTNWIRLRNDTDVTVDDTAIDGTTPGRQFTDFSANHTVTELPFEPCTVQIGFYGEAPEDATASFGCRLWVSPRWGPCQKVCEITGLCGPNFADFTAADSSARLFYDDLTIAESTLWGDITTRNLLSDAMGLVEFSSRGMSFIYPEFYNVGDGTECTRIKALLRTF
jgi:hypothetical protein